MTREFRLNTDNDHDIFDRFEDGKEIKYNARCYACGGKTFAKVLYPLIDSKRNMEGTEICAVDTFRIFCEECLDTELP